MIKKIFQIFIVGSMLFYSCFLNFFTSGCKNQETLPSDVTHAISVPLFQNYISSLQDIKPGTLFSARFCNSVKVNFLPATGSVNLPKNIKNFSYKLHNDLTYNLPQLCFKFDPSDHTEDG